MSPALRRSSGSSPIARLGGQLERSRRQLLARHNAADAVRSTLAALSPPIIPFDAELALEAGLMAQATRSAGLSLGDRACLALAKRLGVPALTADRAWASIAEAAGVEIVLIR